MPDKAQDDELVMSLVELALARPREGREKFVRDACEGDGLLFTEVWNYVQWEERMQGFLLEPLYTLDLHEEPFQPSDLLEGRFRIVREIAQGGMGVVYEAFDEKLERRIAIKCAKSGFRKRLPPEVRNASEISHHNVCKIFEIHTAATDRGEIDFITMEFLEGETLAERLTRGPLTADEARTIARQLAEGLAEAHRNHVVHGDLKSSNIILGKSADGSIRAVITDFGLAQKPETAERGLGSSKIAGTPDYMAPELWKGGKPSARSDLYALGVILHELATGRRPFGDDSPLERRRIGAIGPAWDSILARCLAPEPEARYANTDELVAALGPSQTRRWLLAAAAGVVVAIAASVITYQHATAPPKQDVRLAVLPVTGDSALAATLSRETAQQFAKLGGGDRIRLRLVGESSEPTHIVKTSIVKDQQKLIVREVLTETRSATTVADWRGEYRPDELRYAPVALAGIITFTLRLPPLAVAGSVNDAAKSDYETGLKYLRSNSGADKALPLLERAVTTDPNSPLTHAGLAEAFRLKYAVTGERAWLDKSQQSVRDAERRNPDLAPVLSISGLVAQYTSFYEAAERAYRRAIELEPNDTETFRRLGQVLERNNDLPGALAAYQRAADLDPGYHRPQQQLGAYYYRLSDHQKALGFFRRAVELAPDDGSAHATLGQAYRNVWRLQEAESELRTSLSIEETPATLNNLATTLMYQGKDADAVSNYVRLLSRWPDRYLAWLNLGTAYQRTGQSPKSQEAYGRALTLVEKEITHDPRNGRLRAELAYLSARRGDTRRAESEVVQALQFSPRDSDTVWWAAAVYEALKQREKTLRVLAAAPKEVIKDLSQWPELTELNKDARFLQLLATN